MAKWHCAAVSLFCALLSISVQAYTASELETFDNEPPIVKNLLERASLLMSDAKDNEATWKAANLYCEASRYGSAEGLYRLGMLYAFGRGVTASRDYAANLFGIAAMHGHFEAQKMLETIEIRTQNTPPCVLEATVPEKAPQYQYADYEGSPAIDRYIATLPQNKRWVVDLVDTIADWYKVDAKLVLSIITAESNFKVSAKSNKDAHGLMQLIPATAERFNVKNAYNASQNIKGGVAYLRWLLSYFRGDVTLAVAAYNAGERAVDRYKGVPPYKETKAYVKKVLALYQSKRHQFDPNIASASPVLEKVSTK
ncbi:MAG: lytic transglycosylase domain-containing protein [Methylophilaceae bacterium]